MPSRPAPRDDADRGELVVEELTEDLGRAQTWPRTPGGAGSARGPPTPPPQPAGGPAPAGAARVALPHLGRHALFDAQVRAPVVGDVVVIGEALGGPQTQIGQGDPVGVGAETRAAGVADALLPAGEGEAVPMLPAAPERGLQHRVQVGDPMEDTDAVWEKTTMSSTRPRRPGKTSALLHPSPHRRRWPRRRRFAPCAADRHSGSCAYPRHLRARRPVGNSGLPRESPTAQTMLAQSVNGHARDHPGARLSMHPAILRREELP